MSDSPSLSRSLRLSTWLGLGLLGFWSVDFIVGFWFADNVAADMKATLGLPPLAVKTFYYLTALVFVSLWWYSVVYKKNTNIFAVVGVLLLPAMYYGSLWYLTKSYAFNPNDRTSLQCYVVMPDRIKRMPAINPGKQQFDPESGRVCMPITAEILPRLTRIEEMVRMGKEIKPVTPEETQFFSNITSEPLLWYVRDGKVLRFYDVPGFDRATGKPLIPVTLEVRDEWKRLTAEKEQVNALWKSTVEKNSIEDYQEFINAFPSSTYAREAKSHIFALKRDSEKKFLEKSQLQRDEERRAEEHRIVDERRRVEEQRLAEDRRRSEEQRIALEQRHSEEQRVVSEQRRADEQRLALEERRADEQRIAAERKESERQQVFQFLGQIIGGAAAKKAAGQSSQTSSGNTVCGEAAYRMQCPSLSVPGTNCRRCQ